MHTADEHEHVSQADFSRLEIKDQATGEVRTRPVVEVVLYSTLSRKEGREGYIQFFEEFDRRYGGRLRWYKTNTMPRCKPLPVSATEQVVSLLGGKEAEKAGLLGLEQHSGDTADDFLAPSFKFFSEEVRGQSGKMLRRTFLRVCLPPHVADKPRAVLDLLSTGLTKFFPHSGYAGFSLYWDGGDSDLEDVLEQKNKAILKGFPGLGYGDLFTFQSFIGFGVIQTGWITLLSQELVAKLGGSKKLVDSRSPGVEVVSFPNTKGFALIAGPKPQLGSRLPREVDRLQSYRDVGRALAPIRLPDEYLEHINIPGLDEEETREWFLRFFGDEVE